MAPHAGEGQATEGKAMRILGKIAFAIGIVFSVIAAGFLFGPGGVFAAAAIWLLALGLVLLT
jgi:hypothetical protein